jgi:hypothetical protein
MNQQIFELWVSSRHVLEKSSRQDQCIKEKIKKSSVGFIYPEPDRISLEVGLVEEPWLLLAQLR